MKLKKLFLGLGVLALGATMASCDKDEDTLSGTYDLKVWAAEAVVETTKTQLTEFAAQYPDLTLNFEVTAQGEGDAASAMITDVEAGADIFCFAQDQLASLVSAGALSKVTGTKDDVVAANDAGSVAAATVGEDLYAYPLTSDNGYFMYYDKSVIDEASVDSLTDLIQDCKDAEKLFSFQLATDGAWYNAGFFFGVGCESTWTTNTKGQFTAYEDTYNSDKGLIAAKGMNELINSGVWNNASSVGEFNSGSAIVVSGTWDYEAAKTALGDNLGVTDLPSFTVDGTSYHIGSFSGNKLMGVKPQVDENKAVVCHAVANYLSGEECQNERFEAHSWGPSNKNVQNTDAVKANPGLVALAKQAEFAKPQGQYAGDWWPMAAAIGTSIAELDANATDAQLKAILETYAGGLDGLING